MRQWKTNIKSMLTGYSVHVITKADAASRKKISSFAIAVMLPVSIAFLNGYLICTRILDLNWPAGLLTGLILAGFIFAVERLLIMSSGGFLLGLLRCVFAVVIATCGSIALKETIFSQDIKLELDRRRLSEAPKIKQEILAKYTSERTQLDSMINYYTKQYDDFLYRAKQEAAGRISGIIGPGPLTKFYIAQAEKIQLAHLSPLMKKRDDMNNRIENELKVTLETRASNEGLWSRIDAFLTITFKDTKNKVVFWMLFALFFGIEIFVWVIKTSGKRTRVDAGENYLLAS